MIKKVGKSEHFFVTHKHFFKKLALFYYFFGKKQALLSAFNAFFTSTFGKSLILPSFDTDASLFGE